MRAVGRAGSTIALIFTAGLCGADVRAEDLYVIERLVVSVNAAPDGSGERVASVRSGERVELLERQDEHARIRLLSGTEGWVRASYLSPDLPMQRRLEERARELEQLREEVSRLESQLMQARVAASASRPASGATALAAPASESAMRGVAALKRGLQDDTPSLWKWVLGSSLTALLGGFALGWRALDRRIRRKYGGLRIY